MKEVNCPCGRDKAYKVCCGLIHQDLHNAKTAEDLMRSRYVAFTKGDGDYLMKSHHSSTRPVSEKDEIERWSNKVKWKGLEVVTSKKGLEADTIGTVEFKASFKERGIKRIIHENSEYGCWVYLGKVEE